MTTKTRSRKPQGIFCCPGVRIMIDNDFVDQQEWTMEGTCPKCKRAWTVTIDASDTEENE